MSERAHTRTHMKHEGSQANMGVVWVPRAKIELPAHVSVGVCGCWHCEVPCMGGARPKARDRAGGSRLVIAENGKWHGVRRARAAACDGALVAR